MDRPTFLSVEDILCIHAGTITKEGGLGGVRDYGLLESAIMLPQQRIAGRHLHRGLAAMAAAYLYHLAQNHPFQDGNKRAGVIAAFVFLDVNGVDLKATQDELERTVLSVASGQMSKRSLTAWMRKHTRRRKRRAPKGR